MKTDIINKIARDLASLETRRMADLDPHGVRRRWQVKAALESAYEAGRNEKDQRERDEYNKG